MSTISTIKQLEERNVACEISLMVWSDRMDLVALANTKGEVTLHRLTWTKAWTLSPPKDNATVTSIAWKPDGKIIAIAYSSNEVLLIQVENRTVLHTIEVGAVSCLSWVQEKILPSKKQTDSSVEFLPEPMQHESEEKQKRNILLEQTGLNLLLVGTTDGCVKIHIFGCFKCVNLNLPEMLGYECRVESVHLSEDFSRLFVIILVGKRVKIVFLESDIFATHSNQLFAVALKYIKLTSLLNDLSQAITTITESWESILLEMDNKLSNYAQKVPPGGVAADFLDLLMFGICSEEMKAFLIHDLTKKGLEKFGQTIEMSYNNIQKLMVKFVMNFGQNITYHLAELRGMARFEYVYKGLGLTESAITAAILSNGAFLIKAGEMQQIINHSVINYKAFFRWLYSAIIHVLEEQIPNEIPKMTQQDLAYIADFLQNFDKIGSQNSGFVMERLGQYLNDAPLSIKPEMSNNEWSNFLLQNKCISENDAILRHFPEMSLIQQFKHLKNSVGDIFAKPLNEHFKLIQTFDCYQSESDSVKVSHVNVNADLTVFCFIASRVLLAELFLKERAFKCVRMRFQGCDVIDAKFYSIAMLSVLFQNNNGCFLSQVPWINALDKFQSVDVDGVLFGEELGEVDGAGLMPRLVKSVEGMQGAWFAVSGSRKVAIVLAENRRKVRLYEMEAEEEEEDEEMNSTTKEEGMSISS